jgi:hypothetical protein
VLSMGLTVATTLEMLTEQASMAGPLEGDAGARERPPPYVEDVNGEAYGSQFHLLSQQSLVPARGSIDSSNCPHGVPIPGLRFHYD